MLHEDTPNMENIELEISMDPFGVLTFQPYHMFQKYHNLTLKQCSHAIQFFIEHLRNPFLHVALLLNPQRIENEIYFCNPYLKKVPLPEGYTFNLQNQLKHHHSIFHTLNQNNIEFLEQMNQSSIIKETQNGIEFVLFSTCEFGIDMPFLVNPQTTTREKLENLYLKQLQMRTFHVSTLKLTEGLILSFGNNVGELSVWPHYYKLLWESYNKNAPKIVLTLLGSPNLFVSVDINTDIQDLTRPTILKRFLGFIVTTLLNDDPILSNNIFLYHHQAGSLVSINKSNQKFAAFTPQIKVTFAPQQLNLPLTEDVTVKMILNMIKDYQNQNTKNINRNKKRGDPN